MLNAVFSSLTSNRINTADTVHWNVPGGYVIWNCTILFIWVIGMYEVDFNYTCHMEEYPPVNRIMATQISSDMPSGTASFCLYKCSTSTELLEDHNKGS